MNKIRLRLASWILGATIEQSVETWRLVHIQVVDNVQSMSDFGLVMETGHAFFYLYESNLGSRRYEVQSDLMRLDQKVLDAKHQKWPYYLKSVKLWMSGRYLEGVPGFNEVDSQDVMAKLSIRP